jgi:hypothetical protein
MMLRAFNPLSALNLQKSTFRDHSLSGAAALPKKAASAARLAYAVRVRRRWAGLIADRIGLCGPQLTLVGQSKAH